MPRYLLGTQCVVDIARRANLPPQRWFESLDQKTVPARNVVISAVTPMILTETFKNPATPFVAALGQACDDLVRRFVDGHRVVPVTKGIADRWGLLLNFPLTYVNAGKQEVEYDYREKLVIASAIEGLDGIPFMLVERSQPAHAALEPQGLKIHDPYVTPP